MERGLLRYFMDCGDDQIIQFALTRAHLNRLEREVIRLMFDECMTQEEIAEHLGYSTRRIQDIWYCASKKMLSIPWVSAFARELKNSL